jgi:predicted RNase H-like nuclease (RuvC/YqgF family)
VQVPPVKPSTTAVSELKAAILAGDAHAEKKALEKVAGSVQEKTTTAVVAAENQQPAPMPVYKNQYTWLKEKVEEMQRKIKEHAELLKEKDLRNRHHRHHHRRPNHFEDDELPSVEEAKHRVQRAERKVRSLKEESARKNARKTERTSRFKMDRVGRRFKSTATATVDDGSSSAAIPLYAKDNSWSAWGWSWLGYPSSVKLDGSDDLLKKYLETRDAQVKKDKNGKLYVEVTDK